MTNTSKDLIMANFIQIVSGKNPIALNFDTVRAIVRKLDGLTHVVFTDGKSQDLNVFYEDVVQLLNVKIPDNVVDVKPTITKPKSKPRVISKGIV